MRDLEPFRIGHRTRFRGFTLVELLVVMGIMAIIVGLAIPALTSVQGSYSLDTVSQAITAQLNLARQTALATNHPVQVRFYLLTDYNSTITGTTSYHTAAGVYRAMQSFQEGDPSSTSGTVSVTPITRPYFFPAPVIIVSPNKITTNGDVSSILANTALTTSATGDASNPLPNFGATYGYSYFHFRGNGRTDLSTTASNNGTLTLVLENAPVGSITGNSAGLPKNYITLQLNFTTGAMVYFRP